METKGKETNNETHEEHQGAYPEMLLSGEEFMVPCLGHVYSEEESENLASKSLLLGGLVVDNSLGGGQDENTELTGGEEVGSHLLDVSVLDIEAGGDNGALVETAEKVDDNLATSGVVDDLEVANVLCNENEYNIAALVFKE